MLELQNLMDMNVTLLEWLTIFFIRKVKKRIAYSSFIDNIWGADLADMQLISKINKGIRFLLYVIDIHSKYNWVILLKDRKVILITNAFGKILGESKRKPNKIWVDKGCQFYNRSMKSWLQHNDIEIHSTHKEGKSVFPERFIGTLKIRFINIWLKYQICVYWHSRWYS